MEELKPLLRTVERRTNPAEPNFEIVEIDGGEFNAILALANLLKVENEALREALKAVRPHVWNANHEKPCRVFDGDCCSCGLLDGIEAMEAALNNTPNNGEANG